jgi:beta-glucanase (GH16 family)
MSVQTSTQARRLAARFFLLALSLLAASSVHAQTSPAPGYTLMWSDEFNGDVLDRKAWCTRYAHGGGAPLQVNDPGCLGPALRNGTGDFLKDERQRYRDFNTRGEALHQVHEGYLSLRCTKTGKDSYAFYESAMIRSKLSFSPSTFESYYVTTRVRLPDVRGSFAAFWLASGFGANAHIAWPPEIDVFEAALNEGEDRANMLRVGGQVQGAQTASRATELTWYGPRFDRAWQNYIGERSLRGVWLEIAFEWTQRGVCTYIQGELAVCENYLWLDNAGSFANPANLLFNLAVGGAWAGRYGIDDSKPMQMDIDYVRVYRKRSIAGSPVPLRGSTNRR